MKPINLIALAALTAVILPGIAHAQAGVPFQCNSDLYQVRSTGSSGGNAALLRFPQAVLTGGGTATNVWGALRTPGINATGFRQQDDYIYGIDTATQLPHLYRLGQSSTELVGIIVTQGSQTPALTASFVPTGATFDDQGRYYFAGQGGGNIGPSAIYRVDNFTTDVDPGTPGVQLGVAAIYPLSTTLFNIGDFGFGPDGNLYGASGTTLAQIQLPASSGTATVVQRAISSVGGIGSTFFSNAGDLYVYDNGSSQLSRVTFDFGASFATGPVSVGSVVTVNGAPPLPASVSATDGASCLRPTTDVSVAVNLPAALAPGSTVAGTLVCTNNGPSAAAAVTCTATTGTAGATLALGACTPSAPVSALRATPGENTISCPFTLTVPGTPGGSDTAPVQVAVTGTVSTVTPETNAANDTVSVNAPIIDALNDPAGSPVDGVTGGVALANVLVNDTLGGAAATLANVALSQVSTTNPNVTLNPATGAINVAPGTLGGTYTVTYRICSLTLPGVCDTAQATVEVGTDADLSVTKTNTPAAGPNDQAGDTVASGTQTTYDIVVRNNGPSSANNAVLRDPVPVNLGSCALGAPACAASGSAACPTTGAGAGQLSVANLQGAGGVVIPTLPNGGSVTVRLSCTVQ